MKYISFVLRSSLDDLRRNKVRTVLTTLGILIGVLSVVLLIAFGLGLKQYIKNQFESLGSNLVIVLPGKILSGGSFGAAGALGGIKFDEEDVFRLKRIAKAAYVVPVFTRVVTVSAEGKSEISDLAASTPEFFIVRNFEIDQGRLYTDADNENRAKKVVLGAKIAEKLFGSSAAAVGKIAHIENQAFLVYGVIKRKGGGGLGGPDLDSFSFVPYKSALSFNTDKKFVAIYLKVASAADIPQLKTEVKQVLRRRYKEDDFSVVEQSEIQDVVTSIFSVLNTILVAIGSISLVVGGVGIMNIMYASVTERTREIGIKRSIGARRRDILFQFMTEAVVLSLLGGLLGLILALATVLLIQPLFPATVSLGSVILALGVSSLIGVFFGVFPANKAAGLSPIDAIRYE